MGNPRILIDTGAIYAFVTRTDPHHNAAKQFVAGWLAQEGVFVLPDVVFAEAMTLLKARVGAEIAIRVGRELRQNPAYSWLAFDEASERETWAVFQRFADKDWSYTDCAILTLARRERITSVFAFDHHFSQMPMIKRAPVQEQL
jgi:predicted nucleic acid-binding protein